MFFFICYLMHFSMCADICIPLLWVHACSFINFFYGRGILVVVDAVSGFYTDEQVDDMLILLPGNLQSLMLSKL